MARRPVALGLLYFGVGIHQGDVQNIWCHPSGLLARIAIVYERCRGHSTRRNVGVKRLNKWWPD